MSWVVQELLLTVGWWLWVPAAALLLWWVKHALFGGFGQQDQSYVLLVHRGLFPHGGPAGAAPLFWLWVTVWLLGTLALRWEHVELGRPWVRVAVAAVLVAAVLSGVRFGTGLWDADKDLGRSYARATVLDGSGEQPAEGDAVWDGRTDTVGMCAFRGPHAMGRAFGGSGANSLRNLLAERFPGLVYSDQDIWGYCDGPDLRTAEPVVVVSVTRQIAWADRTVEEPAGVLLVRGSADGRPELTHRRSVAPGELPGAPYAASVVRAQIAQVQWLGGRGAKDDRAFGYEHTSAAADADNPGEFLLRSRTDGRLYYLTPLVPRDSSSEPDGDAHRAAHRGVGVGRTERAAAGARPFRPGPVARLRRHPGPDAGVRRPVRRRVRHTGAGRPRRCDRPAGRHRVPRPRRAAVRRAGGRLVRDGSGAARHAGARGVPRRAVPGAAGQGRHGARPLGVAVAGARTRARARADKPASTERAGRRHRP